MPGVACGQTVNDILVRTNKEVGKYATATNQWEKDTTVSEIK
jgi:hypothetical protein